MKKLFALLLTLALIITCCGMVAGAADDSSQVLSPANSQLEYKVNILFDNTQGIATQAADGNGNIVLSAVPNTGYAFAGWTLSGQYSIVSGSVDAATLTIKPLSDVTATASYKATGATSGTDSATSTTSAGSTDGSSTAPKTGTAGMLFVLFAVIAGGAVVVLSKKQLSQDK